MCFSDAPKGVDINPKLAELKEGDRLTLTCLVQNSNPEVDMQSYRWYKDGQEINQQTLNTFTVPSVRQRDKGVYQCQARNSVGETMSTNITQVSVKCKYYVYFFKKTTSYPEIIHVKLVNYMKHIKPHEKLTYESK